jgi:hypothetical protein
MGKIRSTVTGLLAAISVSQLPADAKQRPAKRESQAYCTMEVIERCVKVEYANEPVGGNA